MRGAERVSIDVGDIRLLDPEGGEQALGGLPGVQVLVLLRHRHCLPCQQHLVEVQETSTDRSIGLVVVGFSPPDRLAAIVRALGWTGRVLSDRERHLYRRLGIGRAHWWRVYTIRTLRIYASAWRRGRPIRRPDEDTYQLGGDAVMVGGRVVQLWRPRSPDDRPSAREVLGAATAAGRSPDQRGTAR